MARIELRGVAHAYGPAPTSDKDYALRPLELTWEDGGAYALLGPSGCGKTTLLNIISGLLKPSHGQVLFNGTDVTAEPPQRRNIAQVFQFPVIYDTMSVFENLAFPLRNRGLGPDEARARVEEVAELLELTPDLKMRASGLSADMKQRVSLGRGLVRRDVAAILLDEPLTVIDPHVKWLLRRKLKQVHEQLKMTIVYVTHDQVEALTLADRVVVMNQGRVVQMGTPRELFERPVDTFVGYFIGSPGMNLLPCAVEEGGVVVEGHRLPLDAGLCARARGAGGELQLGIRPEFVRRVPEATPSSVRVEITQVEDLGRHKLGTARLGTQTLKVRLSEEERLAPGDTCWLELPPAWTLLYAAGHAVS
ncbi:ABC transporter ATP-binding protein [Melittangium boletus]|uniref:ABC transporter ATP-binding protein n=1 Tax=Melittangium boletus TaxID=83453 RepID=UPI003DA4F704